MRRARHKCKGTLALTWLVPRPHFSACLRRVGPRLAGVRRVGALSAAAERLLRRRVGGEHAGCGCAAARGVCLCVCAEAGREGLTRGGALGPNSNQGPAVRTHRQGVKALVGGRLRAFGRSAVGAVVLGRAVSHSHSLTLTRARAGARARSLWELTRLIASPLQEAAADGRFGRSVKKGLR